MAHAIAEGLAFSLAEDSGPDAKEQRPDRLPLWRARHETDALAAGSAAAFVRHVLESWVLAQHAYWSVGRGLADARSGGKTLLAAARHPRRGRVDAHAGPAAQPPRAHRRPAADGAQPHDRVRPARTVIDVNTAPAPDGMACGLENARRCHGDGVRLNQGQPSARRRLTSAPGRIGAAPRATRCRTLRIDRRTHADLPPQALHLLTRPVRSRDHSLARPADFATPAAAVGAPGNRPSGPAFPVARIPVPVAAPPAAARRGIAFAVARSRSRFASVGAPESRTHFPGPRTGRSTGN